MRKKMHSSSQNISRGDSLSPDLYRIGMQILKLQQLLCHLEENWPENDDNILRRHEASGAPATPGEPAVQADRPRGPDQVWGAGRARVSPFCSPPVPPVTLDLSHGG